MNIVNESCLITSAPTEILVGLAIFFCICGVILFALSIEAGNYPELVRWFNKLSGNDTGARREHCPDVSYQVWHAFAGGYENDCNP